MKIVIVSDAWTPQVNGVVRTLQATARELTAMGHAINVIGPDRYRSVPCPTYPDIRLALATSTPVGRAIAAFEADAVHIATEGPLGLAARRWCLKRGLPFTTAYHTQFPDYVALRTGLDPKHVWRFIRWFHAPSTAVLAATPRVEAALAAHGIAHARRWGRGVDLTLFRPDGPRDTVMAALPGPVQLFVGRVAVEKNLPAFLAAPGPGSKVVVGSGPAEAVLRRAYPHAHFLGALTGEALAAAYRAADVFVFPSLTDTFGLVMAEAAACGTPVAAFPVAGPLDVLTPEMGAMAAALPAAIAAAAAVPRDRCAAAAQRFSWRTSAEQFLAALTPLPVALAA
ncbi:glycosyltransferase family 4 protein [Sphingomonas sp.]|uniref:glycosyltransferase family 4 protein n=1 Tax=Sphingomonas sp. TaxID=28214 RepID=UPI003CC5585E